MKYLAPKPPILPAVQWDGTNFSEIEDLATNANGTATDNNDGTLTVTGGLYGSRTLHMGEWFSGGFDIMPDVLVQSSFQILDDEPEGYAFV
jgi:hypothetical protein